MLNPLDAVSLASAIVQFVDYGSKLIGSGLEIYRSASGVTEEHLHSETVTLHLKDLSGKISDKKVTFSSGLSTVAHAHDDGNLCVLAARTVDIAKELLECLDGLKISQDVKFRSWSALRQAVRSLWSASKIDDLQSRLDGLRGEIALQLLTIVGAEASAIGTSIQDLALRSTEMQIQTERGMLKLRDDLMSAVQQQGDVLKNIVERLVAMRIEDAASKEFPKKKAELLAAIPNLQGSSSARVAAFNERDWYSAIVGVAAQACQDSVAGITDELRELLDAAEPFGRMLHVLESLSFPEMPIRYSEIPETYEDTYAWIFDMKQTPFATWLENTDGIFWINGKAGSGKSTLMKFLSDHDRTAKALQTWSGNDRLILASHFFWITGTPMQKSQQGLLQSLLFHIFRQYPELVQAACPDRWGADELRSQYPRPWSRRELRQAVHATLTQHQLPARFCFFIDGLDEYVDDQYSLVHDEIDEWSRIPGVKICISSRPWNVFESAFGVTKDRSLVLQDFNKTDMDMFVKGKLEQDQRFLRLIARDGSAQSFALEVRDRAQGVFLWVHLIVGSLLRGLTEEDDVKMLQQRLDALPNTLEEYFEHMIENVEDVYRVHTARSLLLAHEATEPLPALAYWYLRTDTEDPNYAFDAKIEPMSRIDLNEKRQDVRKWINSWCKDLMEVVKYPTSNTWEPLRHYRVDFLHRTVKDFLGTSEMQEFLYKRAGLGFSPRSTLCRLFLALSKVVDCQNGSEDEMRAFTFLADSSRHYADQCRIHDGYNPRPILKELERVEKVLRRPQVGISAVYLGTKLHAQVASGAEDLNSDGTPSRSARSSRGLRRLFERLR